MEGSLWNGGEFPRVRPRCANVQMIRVESAVPAPNVEAVFTYFATTKQTHASKHKKQYVCMNVEKDKHQNGRLPKSVTGRACSDIHLSLKSPKVKKKLCS